MTVETLRTQPSTLLCKMKEIATGDSQVQTVTHRFYTLNSLHSIFVNKVTCSDKYCIHFKKE